MAKRKKQTLDDFNALFDSLSSTDTGIDFSRLGQCQGPSGSTPEPDVRPVSDFPALLSGDASTSLQDPCPPAADDTTWVILPVYAQTPDGTTLAGGADTTINLPADIQECSGNNQFSSSQETPSTLLANSGDTTPDTTSETTPETALPLDETAIATPADTTIQEDVQKLPLALETSPASPPNAGDAPLENINRQATLLDDAHLASIADTTDDTASNISEHQENIDFSYSSKTTDAPSGSQSDTTPDTTSERPGEPSEDNDLLLFWEAMNPNARELYRYLAELPEMRLSLRSAPILDCKGKTMLYLTRRRAFDTLCAKGVVTAHEKIAVGSYQGMTFELNETLRNPFFRLFPDPPYISGDTTHDTTTDTTTKKIKSAATEDQLTETPPSSGTRLELHPEYAFWRDHGLGQRQITRWQQEFDMDEVLLDCYLRWAAWSIGQKNKDGSGKPIDKPVSWFYKILRQNGAFEKPSDYKSYEDMQAERLQAILEERRQSREKVSRIRSEIATLDLEGELDAVIEAGAGTSVYDRLVSGVAPAAMKKPDLLRQILLERFRKLRTQGEL